MYSFVFYVPVDHCESVKNAVFAAGAGKIGHYDQCSWQVLGQGQFRPLQGSDAFIGQPDQLAFVDEYRVEMVCSDKCVDAVIAALKKSHPYEQPAYVLNKSLRL